jgi:hypothetical protein
MFIDDPVLGLALGASRIATCEMAFFEEFEGTTKVGLNRFAAG